jgi:short-subunit dehydrogenase
VRPAALVTGATSGIGLRFAHRLASDGHDLFLVARTMDRLTALAEQLRGDYGVEVCCHAEDLTEHGAAARVLQAVERSRFDIAVLVNNAGFRVHGAFVDHAADDEGQMVMLNVLALQQLTRLVLPLLLRRGGGHVLNLGSTAGLKPVPQYATYAATKAFVISFSQALGDELRDTGVSVTVLCPGPTETRFAAVTEAEHGTPFASSGLASADEVARTGLAAMRKGRAVVIAGAKGRLLAWSSRFVPHAVLVRSRGLMTTLRALREPADQI